MSTGDDPGDTDDSGDPGGRSHPDTPRRGSQHHGGTRAQGPGSVAIGGDNYGAVTTNVTQNIRQFLLFGPRSRTTVDEMTDRLAGVVRRQWSDEASQLNVHSGDRLPVTWNPISEGLCGSVAEARAWVEQHDSSALADRGAGWAASDDGLAGANLRLADVWLSGTPTRRLVVLGEPGSGKSELMLRTVVEVLGRRAEFGWVVPILVPAAAWDGAPHPASVDSLPVGDESSDLDRSSARTGQPRGDSVELWLERWLIRNYRFLGQLASGGGAASYALALLRAHRLAIIVDGFDEIPPEAREGLLWYLRDDIHANPQRILLLTSRPVEYTRVAITHTPAVLGAATGVKIVPQRGEDVLEYLRRDSLPRSRWDTVSAAVKRGGTLSAVLETPMMVLLAGAVYNAAGDRSPDPDDLLQYTSPKAVEQHLLDSYVATRYRDERRWRLDEVTRWLRFLASSLSKRANPTDLTWWNLRAPRPGRPGFGGVGTGFSVAGHRAWVFGAVLAAAISWTIVSATTFNGWIYQDLELGVVAAARVTAAAVICYLAVVALTRNLGAGVLAVAGAYIAGSISASYDLAVTAAIAGGFAWRPLSAGRFRWWQLLLFSGAVATAGTVLQDDTPSAGSVTGTPWTMGFGSGFADGWASRGDEVVNGWLLSALVAGLLLWTAVRVTPIEDRSTAAATPSPLRSWWPLARLARSRWAPSRPSWAGPTAAGAAVGVVTAVLGGLTDGVRADVTHGWMTGPAGGWAAGVAVWCAATWIGARRARAAGAGARPFSGQGRADQNADDQIAEHHVLSARDAWRVRAVRRAWRTAVLIGLVTVAVNGVGYTARTDMENPWHRTVAEGLGVAVVVWFVVHPDRVSPVSERGRGRFGGWAYAVVAAVAGGCLDAVSAGWGRAAITGLSIGLIVAYTQQVLRRPAGAGRIRRGLLVSPLDAGAFVAMVTGVAAGFAYGLLLGVVFGLAVQVSRDVSRRRFPSRAPRLTWLGTTGGVILGTVVAVAAGFSGVPLVWLFPIAVTSGAVAAIAFGAQGEDVTENSVLSPWQLLRADRRTFLTAVVFIAVGLGLAAGTRTVAQGGSVFVGGVAVMSTIGTYGVTAGLLIAVGQSRYGAYALWRLIYAARGQLPWRLMTFLSVAHDRGILRQNGAVYQFRHQFLQDRLTDTG